MDRANHDQAQRWILDLHEDLTVGQDTGFIACHCIQYSRLLIAVESKIALEGLIDHQALRTALEIGDQRSAPFRALGLQELFQKGAFHSTRSTKT